MVQQGKTFRIAGGLYCSKDSFGQDANSSLGSQVCDGSVTESVKDVFNITKPRELIKFISKVSLAGSGPIELILQLGNFGRERKWPMKSLTTMRQNYSEKIRKRFAVKDVAAAVWHSNT